MRAIWWLVINFGIMIIFRDLSDQMAAYNQDMSSTVFGVGVILFVLIWTMVLSQAVYTRIHRTIGYLIFSVGTTFCIFMTGVTLGMLLDTLNAQSGNQMPGSLAFFGGILVAVVWLAWSIIVLVRNLHPNSLLWRILETHKLVGADPLYQSPIVD